jgi:2'-5' RNA ligase
MTDPLILTLWMDDASAARFDAVRKANFPPERNFIPAHLTLFHHLPGAEQQQIEATLREVCREQREFQVAVSGVRSLGRGTAFTLDSEELSALRRLLAAHWQDWLGTQDRQGFRPHVTVQNKVTPEEARALLANLSSDFVPFRIGARGLLLWRYLGGPWQELGRVSFRDEEASAL